MSKKQRRIHRGWTFWKDTVAEFEESGLTQGAFARSNGLKPSTLGRWVKKLGSRNDEALVQAEFIEVVSSSKEHSLVPVSMRLHVGGAAVEFSALPPVPYMAELLRAVATC